MLPTVRRAIRPGRILLLALLLAAVQLGSLANPAWACGCGAAIPENGSTMGVPQEASAVSWDGRTEDLVMRFTVTGDTRTAAWIMPVPHRAEVHLGDPALFTRLDEQNRPKYRTSHYFWPRGNDWPDFGHSDYSASEATPRPSVTVNSRQRLGPFDVANLSATDPSDLAQWLHRNGFVLPAGLDQDLKPYVRQHWQYVAVRLAPARAGSDGQQQRLAGTLDPLHLTFRSEQFTYPMRLSHRAADPQHLLLYVLGAHRVRPAANIGGPGPRTEFADRIPRSAVPHDSIRLPVKPGQPLRLTIIRQDFPDPSRIHDDIRLVDVPGDAAVRRVVTIGEIEKIGPFPAWFVVVFGTLFVLAAAAVVIPMTVLRRRRLRRTAAVD